MDLVVWKPEYSVGVKEIDLQHRRLVQMIRVLQESIRDNFDSPAVGRTLRELVQYTRTHFRDEEALMEKIGYADLNRHREAHRKLVGEIVTILEGLKAGQTYTGVDLIAFLRHWLVDHILAEDTRIATALRQRLAEANASR
jgi:hemerythrin-like metal-binding protein